MTLHAPYAPRLYRRCAFTGLAAGVAATTALALRAGLDLRLLTGALALSCAVYWAGALARKVLTGEERLVRYHGELTALGTTAATAWMLGAPVLPYLDALVPGLAIMFAFGRFGCHAAGCCHGRPAPHGVMYRSAHAAEGFPLWFTGVRLWPVQLIESALAGVLAITCAYLALRSRSGEAFTTYLAAYGAARFGLEFLRGDERPSWNGLSEAQLIAAANVTLTLFIGGHAWHFAAFAAVAAGAVWAVRSHARRSSLDPGHLREIAVAVHSLRTTTGEPIVSFSCSHHLSGASRRQVARLIAGGAHGL